MSDATIMEVVVHKAALPLLKAETVRQFSDTLSNAGRDYLKRKYNLQKFDDVWMAEVMSDKAIFSIFKDKPNDGVRMRYYATKYSRDPKGTFTFGETKEVRRMTVFEPVEDGTTDKSVAKACKPKKSVEDSAWVSKAKTAFTQKEKWVDAATMMDWGSLL